VGAHRGSSHTEDYPRLLIARSLVRHRARAASLDLGHALRGRSRRRAAGGRSGLLRGVLRGALGLQLLGVEDAIASETSIGQGLGIVFEGIGRGLGAAVRNLKSLIILYQDEVNFSAVTLDRTRLHIPRDAQSLGVGGVSHTAQFLDGDVVTLTLLHPGVGQVSEREQDDYGRAAELEISAGFARHEKRHRLHELYSSAQAWVKDRKDIAGVTIFC
jgi:hypothetical protein